MLHLTAGHDAAIISATGIQEVDVRLLHRKVVQMDVISSFQSLVLVTLAAFAVPLVASRVPGVRVPVVVGEILIGIVMGKSGFEIVSIGPSLEFLSTLGFAYLMFLLGLEIDFDLLAANLPRLSRNFLGQPLGLGRLSFALTLCGAGFAAAAITRTGLASNPWLMALILSTTSVGIVLPTIKERKLNASALGQSILVAALVADFATITLISLVAGFIRGGGPVELLAVTALLGVFVLVVILGKVFGRMPGVERMMGQLDGSTAQIGVRGSIMLVLVFVALSQWLGVELILGGFLAGAAVALLAPRESHNLRSKLDAIGYGVFVPFFFIKVGMTFDLPALLGSPSTLMAVPSLIVAAYVVKLLGGTAFRLSFSWRESLAAGTILSSRLALIIAASSIGLSLGAITEAANAGIMLVAIITSTVSPLVFSKLLDTQPALGSRVIALEETV
jgi:trk system potassium uptake protein TrkA